MRHLRRGFRSPELSVNPEYQPLPVNTPDRRTELLSPRHASYVINVCGGYSHSLQITINSAPCVCLCVSLLQAEGKKYELMGSCGQQRFLQDSEGE